MALDVTLDDIVFENLVRTKHVSIESMDHLLADCTDHEADALVSIVEASKAAIRKI